MYRKEIFYLHKLPITLLKEMNFFKWRSSWDSLNKNFKGQLIRVEFIILALLHICLITQLSDYLLMKLISQQSKDKQKVKKLWLLLKTFRLFFVCRFSTYHMWLLYTIFMLGMFLFFFPVVLNRRINRIFFRNAQSLQSWYWRLT